MMKQFQGFDLVFSRVSIFVWGFYRCDLQPDALGFYLGPIGLFWFYGPRSWWKRWFSLIVRFDQTIVFAW